MEKTVSMRILHLMNNFYHDDVGTERKASGKYCVFGYFDAFDILEVKTVKVKQFNSWEQLGELTVRLDGTVNSRTLVCITEREEEDKAFWDDESYALFFITMVRVKPGTSANETNRIIDELGKTKERIGYLSYDHSEIIVAAKTNRYSDGIKGVKDLHNIYGVVKTYTIFAVMEKYLMSYETICNKIEDEKVFYRLHCMVKNYEEAEKFRLELEQKMKARNGNQTVIHTFETFGGYDWVMELNEVSICSILECYKMGKLLTHANEGYNRAFYNIESKILVESGEKNVGYMDRRTETRIEENI